MAFNKKLIVIAPLIAILAWGVIRIINIEEETNSRVDVVAQKLEDDNIDKEEQKSLGFIDMLKEREFMDGEIVTEETISVNESYTSYIISYPSDELKIYGVMNVPSGDGPFPIIILNHGYYNQSTFTSGDGTRKMADILAREGYLTLASDYRGHGKSENDSSKSGGHRPEYAIDVLNLITSIASLDKADKERVGMWGHSLGGEVSLRVAEATDTLDAIVLWAPTSGKVSDNASFYGGKNDSTSEVKRTEAEGASPINFLDYISSPISLHQGLSDTEVDPIWSTELNDALIKEQKEVEYFEYPGQDHNFRNLGWGEISKNTLNFFDKYLKSEK